MKAVFYAFNKRKNSTKLPNSEPTEFDILINDETSTISPTINLRGGAYPGFNYCYIKEFKRYYFVEDWSYNANTGYWVGNLTVDALASWRGDIGNSELYLLRASRDFNGNIIDTYYPCTTDVVRKNVSIDFSWGMNPNYPLDVNNCVYVITTIGRREGGEKATNTLRYATTTRGIAEMFNTLFSDSMGAFVGDKYQQALCKTSYNPMQYIANVKAFPSWLSKVTGGGLDVPLKIGPWDVKLISSVITVESNYYDENITVTIPKHPQASARGNYLNSNGFSKYSLYFPPFGVIPLDAYKLIDKNEIDLKITVDTITGSGVLKVIIDGVIIFTTTAQIAIDIPIAASRPNVEAMTGVGQGIIGAIASIPKLDIGGIASNAFSACTSAITSQFPSLETKGSTGGFGGLVSPSRPSLQAEFYLLVGEDRELAGRPLCELRRPKTLGGYMLAQEGDILTGATMQEKAIIKEYLESGFYYE